MINLKLMMNGICLNLTNFMPTNNSSWWHDDVINGNIFRVTGPITSLTVVYSTVYSDADQRKHQSFASLAFVWGIHRSRWTPHTKASDAEFLMFSLICVWMNGWVNNREAGDLRCHRGHYDVNVMNSGQRYLHETDTENRFNLVKESRCSYIQNVLGKLFICVSSGDRIVCDIYFHI